jgi:predicted HAD superfamily Cof-like phosphohydrolase
MSMVHRIDLVREFHETFDVPNFTAWNFKNREINKLRINLLIEEAKEFRVAYKAKDRVAMLDGLCDLEYVLCGALLQWGIWDEAEFRHEWSLTNGDDLSSNIIDSIAELNASILAFLEVAAIECCENIENEIQSAVWGLQFLQFDAAFQNVHESNMSKLWNDAEKDASCHPLQWFTKKGDLWICRNSLGKVLKSPSFIKPQLEQFI